MTNKFKFYFEQSGMTVKQACKQIFPDHPEKSADQLFRNLISGKSKMHSRDTIIRFCETFNVEPNNLFTNDN